MRPLSFLTDIEALIRKSEASALPQETVRSIDFRRGLARLQLTPEGDEVLVQCFELADGRDCLKAVVRWSESEVQRELAVYPTETNRATVWRESAQRVARLWLEGAPAVARVDALPGAAGVGETVETVVRSA